MSDLRVTFKTNHGQFTLHAPASYVAGDIMLEAMELTINGVSVVRVPLCTHPDGRVHTLDCDQGA